MSTRKTRVLFSSIFFIALSVFRGWMMILCSSRRGTWGMDLRRYLGERESWRVLGRWKLVEVRTLRLAWALSCCDVSKSTFKVGRHIGR